MSFEYIPILEVFLGMLGCGLSILFCTTFCRVCSRLRVQHLERETWTRSEQDGRPPSIYFIPIHGSVSQQDEDEHLRVARHSQELHTPPQYSPTVYCGPPPSYNELGVKPDDLPPPYTEQNIPMYPVTLPPHSDVVQSQIQLQP